MPRKKINIEEETQRAAEMAEQPGMETTAPEEPPQDTDGPGADPPPELGEPGDDLSTPEDGSGLPEEDTGDAPEVMEVDVSAPPAPPDDGPEDWPPMEPPYAAPEEGPPVDAQEAAPAGDAPTEDMPPADQAPPAMVEVDPLSLKSEEDAPPTPPLTDRQSFFALDFRELDRGLSPEERQAWNSIYASFRGRSALSGTVIGADPHSMNVRSKETGRVERRTMYCVVVLVYRVPVYIPEIGRASCRERVCLYV